MFSSPPASGPPGIGDVASDDNSDNLLSDSTFHPDGEAAAFALAKVVECCCTMLILQVTQLAMMGIMLPFPE